MYIGPSLPSLSHSFHVNGLQTGQKWRDTVLVPHLYPNGVHIFIYPQFYIIKVPQCTRLFGIHWGTHSPHTISPLHVSFFSKYSSRSPFPISFPLYIVLYMPTFHVNGFKYNKTGGIPSVCLKCALIRHIFSIP